MGERFSIQNKSKIIAQIETGKKAFGPGGSFDFFFKVTRNPC